jgi:ribosomal protein S18 acetylase RimI-like enzyme
MSRRGRGYASAAMDELERIAREDLGCKTITLNTLPSRYLVDPGWWASQGYKKPLDTPVYEYAVICLHVEELG